MEATATAQETIRFLSKYQDHDLIMVPATAPYRGPDGRTMPGNNGKHLRFEGITYDTSDPEEIAFLRNHELFNVDIWEFGRAPGEARPTVDEQLSAITRASVDRDAVALQAILDSERETHNRALIIGQAETSLRSIAGVDSEV